jgi:hypothetical protein
MLVVNLGMFARIGVMQKKIAKPSELGYVFSG